MERAIVYTDLAHTEYFSRILSVFSANIKKAFPALFNRFKDTHYCRNSCQKTQIALILMNLNSLQCFGFLNKLKFFKTVFYRLILKNLLTRFGSEGRISIDADSGPLRCVL